MRQNALGAKPCAARWPESRSPRSWPRSGEAGAGCSSGWPATSRSARTGRARGRARRRSWPTRAAPSSRRSCCRSALAWMPTPGPRWAPPRPHHRVLGVAVERRHEHPAFVPVPGDVADRQTQRADDLALAGASARGRTPGGVPLREGAVLQRAVRRVRPADVVEVRREDGVVRARERGVPCSGDGSRPQRSRRSACRARRPARPCERPARSTRRRRSRPRRAPVCSPRRAPPPAAPPRSIASPSRARPPRGPG